MKKRVISLVLCLLMALSLIPTTAFAVDADPSAEAGSTGTAGEVTVNKTAAPVEGMVNTWDITLTVTAKDPTPAPPNAQMLSSLSTTLIRCTIVIGFLTPVCIMPRPLLRNLLIPFCPQAAATVSPSSILATTRILTTLFMALIIRRAQRTMSIVFLSIAMNIRAVPISRLLSILPLVF